MFGLAALDLLMWQIIVAAGLVYLVKIFFFHHP